MLNTSLKRPLIAIRYLIFTTLFIISCGTNAEPQTAPLVTQKTPTIHVVDQTGAPVSNAVISLLQGEITSVPSDAAIMDQVDLQFKPLVLTVKKGRQVIFPNSDNIRHHVYSFSEPKSFEIKLYAGVPKQPLLFDQAGIAVLGCNIHDSMVGYIYVADSPYFWQTSETGQISLAGVTAINQSKQPPERIRIWHPWSDQGTSPIEVKLSDYKVAGEGMNSRYKIVLNITPPAPFKTNTFKRQSGDDYDYF